MRRDYWFGAAGQRQSCSSNGSAPEGFAIPSLHHRPVGRRECSAVCVRQRDGTCGSRERIGRSARGATRETESMADAEGNVVYEGQETLVTLKLEEEGKSRTRMTLWHAGLPEGDHRKGAGEGYRQAFEKLAAALEREEKGHPRHYRDDTPLPVGEALW